MTATATGAAMISARTATELPIAGATVDGTTQPICAASMSAWIIVSTSANATVRVIKRKMLAATTAGTIDATTVMTTTKTIVTALRMT